MVDGERIATRERGFLNRLLGGGFPDPRVVVESLRQRLDG